jgi:hypothetical protein
VSDLQQVVNASADAADLHAPVPTLLLELQTLLGNLSASVSRATNRGRGPFRPNNDWTMQVGELAYFVYVLADQSGIDLNSVVPVVAKQLELNQKSYDTLEF